MVFIKEIVPRFAIAAVARTVYNENYIALPMQHRIDLNGTELRRNGAVEYSWRYRDKWNRIEAVTSGEALYPASGSEEEFITEHYRGYAAQRDRGCVEYRVEHPPWRVWKASQARFNCQVRELYGEAFTEPLNQPPCSAFVAEGSPVTVHRGVRL